MKLKIASLFIVFFFTIAAIPNSRRFLGTFPQCSTPVVTLRFSDVARCPNGSICSTTRDCNNASCIASPVDPTSILVDIYSGGQSVVSSLPATASAGLATISLPRIATRFSGNGSNLMVVRWTTVCANNQTPCSSDTSCPGSVCLRNSEEAEFSIKKITGEDC